MQKDFHFYTIYALCRCNGMSPENAKKVAYASQHTDDAKYDHPLNFENGGRFQQVLSAHKFIHPGVFGLDTQYRIYIPFHFLPGNQGKRFQERMVCRANSEIAQHMVSHVANLNGKPYQLHRLGISLHVYADTWSHQDFSGLQTELNDIEDISVTNEKKHGIAKIFTDFFRDVTESLIPQVGHAEAATLPDEPFREWTFYHVLQKRPIRRKNWLICKDASRAIYKEIKGFVTKNPEYKEDQSVPWGSIKKTLADLFKEKGILDERCRRWAEKINASGFGYLCQPEENDLSYDDREWFREAVDVQTTGGTDLYQRKMNFHLSDWKHFHDAAASHRFYILHESLAPQGIICG
jgi:hypothetical protein